ncbi:MAG: alpha/beta hydrolase [Flavobacteriaceae bacterium]|nr:alpha/beta hydrolase [Flavobacteriaceae bacterium]
MSKSKLQKLSQIRMKLAYKAVLLKGKVSQVISLKLGTYHAIKLFRTPFKFKTPKREFPMISKSRKELIIIKELQKEIMVYHYGNSDKKVLLIHGWSGRGTQLFKIADSLLENGFSTISFDAPAHGHSSGNETMMSEFIICTRILNEKYGPFEFGIGHSLGGMTLLNAINRGVPFRKAICIGSGNSIFDIMKEFVEKLEMKPIIAQMMKTHYDKEFGVDLEQFSSYQVAKNIEIPVLIIHDTDDEDVPVKCAYDIIDNLKNGELMITNKLGHRKVLGDKKVLEKILNFMNA